MLSKPIPPCKDCKNRVVGCHSTCEEYISYKNENEKYITALREVRNQENAMEAYFSEARRKSINRRGRK